MIVTEVRKNKKGENLLFCGSINFLSLSNELMMKNGIKVGMDIDDETVEVLKRENEIFKAKEKALNLLSYRARSKKELKDRVKRITEDDYADIAIEKMENLGLVDDEAFAMQYAGELFSNKKLSISAVKYKLAEKGISGDIIEDTLNKINVDEKEQILYLLKRKFYNKYKENKNKVINALRRLGYGWSAINEAFSLYEEGVEEDGLI